MTVRALTFDVVGTSIDVEAGTLAGERGTTSSSITEPDRHVRTLAELAAAIA